jgi:Putative adhesin
MRKAGGMARWTVSEPANLDFDEVTAAKVRVIGGSVAILSTDGTPSLTVESISGEPLQVIHEDGELTITYEELSWDGVLKWLRPQRHTVRLTLMVPRKCVTQLGVVSANAVLSGISGRAAVRGVSGSVTLDGVSGDIEANTVSGAVEAQGLNGSVSFHSVSGDLTLAGGWLERLDVNTVSGDVTADVDLDPVGGVQVTTVSGAVTLRLPADANTNVQMHSVSGDIRSEFDGLSRSSAIASRSVRGNLGAGSAHVSVSTMSGRIMLLRGPERDNAGDSMEMEGEAN